MDKFRVALRPAAGCDVYRCFDVPVVEVFLVFPVLVWRHVGASGDFQKPAAVYAAIAGCGMIAENASGSVRTYGRLCSCSALHGHFAEHYYFLPPEAVLGALRAGCSDSG